MTNQAPRIRILDEHTVLLVTTSMVSLLDTPNSAELADELRQEFHTAGVTARIHNESTGATNV